MPGKIPDTIWLYRIVHYTNLEFVLRDGMFTKDHPQHDPDYMVIGDNQLIGQRHDYPVGLAGKGNLGDYVPLYFGPLSVMLLNIKTGYRGITKRPQRDIVYICCKMEVFEQKGLSFVFTDGHAKDLLTNFYTSLDDLKEVDWDIIGAKYWNNIPEDDTRQRRKQAEFLVHEHVPPDCISALVVYDQKMLDFATEIIQRLDMQVPTYIDSKGKFYYQ